MCEKKIQANDDKLYKMLFELSLLISLNSFEFLTILSFKDYNYLVVF